MEITERTHNSVTYLAAEGFGAGVRHGFSTRLGGVSEGMWASLNLGVSRGDDPDHVRENYRRFFAAIGVEGGRLAMTNQIHGGAVRTVTTADLKADPYDKVTYEADGLMTDLPGVALVIYSADCIPILFYDPERRVIAAVHAGWRGTAAGIATAAVARMKDVYGCRPENILAAIGPGIGPDCFETHEDVPNAMTAALSTAVLQHIKIKENGKFSVDLKGVNAMRLEQAGLDPAHIAVSQVCTACDQERFWSHRRQGTSRGSMAAAIQLA
ncbi:MAG: peptidoglycan editing factor PgeF [Oscillospiraceae bacterium]|nr:peptidoglycan editing factor PgeF [Oscillospiraceae bacterium]MDE6839775.1 peptidoglycan editing factor PgeF [Oscillospiraceae bacterium]